MESMVEVPLLWGTLIIFQDSMLNFMFVAFSDYLMIGHQRIATRTQDNKMNSQTKDHHNNSNNKNRSKLCDQIEYWTPFH